MTPELLRTAGEALYGPRWQRDLARDLDMDDRTMRRWATGERPIPARVSGELVGLLRRRGDICTALADRLTEYVRKEE